MVYYTKYNIGDKVWVVYKDKVCQLYVSNYRIVDFISTITHERKYVEVYDLEGNDSYTHMFSVNVDCLFKTKDELLKSL